MPPVGGLYVGAARRPRRWRAALLALVAVAALVAGVVVASESGADRRGARIVKFTVHSRLVGRDLRQQAVVPAGIADGERRPLLVMLHGRSGHPGDFFSDELYAALARLGPRAPVVVEVSGGDHSYYHDRRAGRWGSYVMHEAIPAALKRLPADPERVAIGGISMGGFGALDLARLQPRRFCAVGAHSPALWRSAGETAPGAFDDAADFSRHDVIASAASLRGVPVWVDGGDDDPFRPGADAFAAALRAAGAKASVHTWSGGHDRDYWDAHWGAYLGFYASKLARC
jgi:S-formylglutathione hydrolase FrmB